MERFVHNINRNKKLDYFADRTKLLYKQHLDKKSDEEIVASIIDSHGALIDMIE